MIQNIDPGLLRINQKGKIVFSNKAAKAMEGRSALDMAAIKKPANMINNEKEKCAISDQYLYYVLVGISDSGIGIKTEDLKKIFNPFLITKPDGLGFRPFNF